MLPDRGYIPMNEEIPKIEWLPEHKFAPVVSKSYWTYNYQKNNVEFEMILLILLLYSYQRSLL